MIACVKRTGLSFIVDNLSQIRYELIYYILLKADANPIELNKLKEAILSEDEHPIQGMMETEHIIELMDKLAAQETDSQFYAELLHYCSRDW